MPSSCLWQVDFPVGQESFLVLLCKGQSPRKVICQSIHRKGNKNKHALASGKQNFKTFLSKGQAQILNFL